MTKQMRKQGVMYFNRRTGDMYRIECGVTYKRTRRNTWLVMLGTSEMDLLSDEDVIYLDAGRNLLLVFGAVIAIATAMMLALMQ